MIKKSDKKEEILAEELAKKQREISISAFFEKNRHLLGFDNPVKALATTVKELVDNSLDATEEMKSIPDIIVQIKEIGENRYSVSVEDNGPGIVKEQIPRVFAKLLYGSKFYGSKQQRGQQGIGVCMPSNTLIPLGDGKILPINKIVEEKINGDLFVLTPNLKLGLGKINRFWKIPTPSYLMNLKMLGGVDITLTPENTVLTRNKNGFEWKDAESVRLGDYITVSRKLATHTHKDKIAIFDFLDDDTRIDNYDFTLKVLYKLKKKYGTWHTVGRKFGLDKEQLKGWYKKNIRRRPTKKLLELFCFDLGIPKKKLIKNCRRVGKLGNYVTIPLFVNEDFMSFLGYISGDGSSQPKRKDRWGRNLALWNDNKKLKQHFEKIVYRLFKIRAKYYKHSKGRGEMVQFSSSLVARLVNIFGIPSGKKFNSFKISPILHRKGLLRPYLRALFDCEGSVSSDRETVSFMIRNKNMIKYMSLFLLQFGIFCRVNKANNDLRLIVSGENNVKRFYEEIGFYHSGQENKLKKIIKNGHLDTKHSQIERVPFISKQLMSLRNRLSLKNSDFVYSHIFSRNRPISYPILFSTYKTFMSKIKDKKIPIELQELYCLLNSDIIFVPVIKKSKSESREPFVYDLTMLHGNNFIANGVLVHNSASVLYGQLTTSKPVRITSRISPKKPTHYYELHIDIAKNEPEIVVDKEITWMKDHGTKVEIELEGKYQKGRLGVDEYLKQTAIANPHLNLVYINPLNEKVEFKKVTNELPKEPKEIKPHPYGIELGILVRMLRNTESRNLRSFLTNEFSRVSNAVADEIINKAALKPEVKPKDITHKDADKIFKVIQQTKIMAPPTDCLSPISEELLLKGLKKEVTADFYATVSRSPAVYRGIPFQVEVAIAYGGSSLRQDELVRLIRFANRVPLIYQQSACAITKSVVNTDWKNYGLQQSKGALPSGPAVIVLHIASVWVPFTSESKEAIAHYPEIIKEIKLALQEVGRKLNAYIRKNVRVKEAKERVSLFEKYIPEVADALAELTRKKKSNITADLQKILKKGLPELMAQANGEQTNDKGKK